MNKQSKTNQKTKGFLAAGIVILLVAVMALVYAIFGEKAVEGKKHICVEIVSQQGESKVYEVDTNQQYLMDALLEIEDLEILGEDGPYGMMITIINGELAEYNTNGAYWSIMVNGEYGNYGVSEQPIEDGDAFQIVFTPAQ